MKPITNQSRFIRNGWVSKKGACSLLQQKTITVIWLYIMGFVTLINWQSFYPLCINTTVNGRLDCISIALLSKGLYNSASFIQQQATMQGAGQPLVSCPRTLQHVDRRGSNQPCNQWTTALPPEPQPPTVIWQASSKDLGTLIRTHCFPSGAVLQLLLSTLISNKKHCCVLLITTMLPLLWAGKADDTYRTRLSFSSLEVAAKDRMTSVRTMHNAKLRNSWFGFINVLH